MSTYNDGIDWMKEKFVHPGVQKQLNNMGWMFFARIGTMLITFLATAYIARNLGPQSYGELSYAISFVGIFSFLASLGIDQILHRNLIETPERKNVLLGSAIGLRAMASVVTIVTIVTASLLFSQKDVSLFLIFIISLSLLCGSFQLLGYEFQAETKAKYPSILTFVVVFTINILKILIIFLDQGVIYLASLILLESLLYSLGYLYLKSKFYYDVKKLTFDKHVAFSIFKDSYPLMFASAFFMIYSRIDQVMLKNMIDAKTVGLYDAAVRISEVSYFIPQTLLVSLFPAIINAKKTSLELYYKRTKKLLLTLIALALGTALITTIFSRELILLIFGAKFLESLPILHVYAWSSVGATLTVTVQQILVTENLTKFVSVTMFFGMLANVLLNILLIPVYGPVGAAYATLISYIIPFVSTFLFSNTRKIMLGIIKI